MSWREDPAAAPSSLFKNGGGCPLYDVDANNAKNSGDINTKDEVKPKKLTAFHNEPFHDKTKTLKTKCILFP